MYVLVYIVIQNNVQKIFFEFTNILFLNYSRKLSNSHMKAAVLFHFTKRKKNKIDYEHLCI